MKIRDYLGISPEIQNRLSQIMQILLVLAVAGGFYLGKVPIIVNSLVSLLVSFLPAALEKRHDITMDPALILWMTSAVFFHAAGTYSPYGTIWWWDHFTHMLSSSVVAAAGYTAVRAVDEHYDGINLPGKFSFLFILIFVISFGVIWELLEFGISGLAEILGVETVLTQHGLEDSMLDLVFDSLGGIIVAVFGEAYLTGIVEQMIQKLEK